MMFQSTPPAEARGDLDLDAAPRTTRSREVSIHSPRRSEGRLCRLRQNERERVKIVSIHSPRRSEGRQDPRCERVASVFERSFNPLPPPKRGETGFYQTVLFDAQTYQFQSTPPAEARGDRQGLTTWCRTPLQVSIHSPRRSEGRLRGLRLSAQERQRKSFNPLPPPKRGETMARDRVTACTVRHYRFQSTPPAEARGDHPRNPASQRRRLEDVSIHSPRRSEGRPHSAQLGFRSGQSGSVSIHSPRRSEGRQATGVPTSGFS